MHKKYRLRASASFQSIRHEGHVLLHPYVVMSWLPNGLEYSRFGFSVGRRIGKAVRRNQIKRWMREAIRLRIQNGKVTEGWDVVFIARYPVREASFHHVDQAIGLLLHRAGMVSEAP